MPEASLSRRRFVAGAAALPLFGILTRRAAAAEFVYKLATGQDPNHPVNIRTQQAIDRIREASGGRLEIRLFPANQLGADTDLLAQVRSGAVEFLNLSSSVLATFLPVASLTNLGFAFKDYDSVWAAIDGPLGAYVREQIGRTPILTVSKAWDNGFRHVTSSTLEIRTPDDIRGFKIRVPQAPMQTSLFRALEAGATPINFNELYSALQTKVVEGQENPLPITATTRIYEVQKSCSLTGHIWDAYWILGNRRAWARLPEDLRMIVGRELDRSADDERADNVALNANLRTTLAAKGLTFVDVDRDAFRDALVRTSFYRDWKAKLGPTAWDHLESVTGKLA